MKDNEYFISYSVKNYQRSKSNIEFKGYNYYFNLTLKVTEDIESVIDSINDAHNIISSSLEREENKYLLFSANITYSDKNLSPILNKIHKNDLNKELIINEISISNALRIRS